MCSLQGLSSVLVNWALFVLVTVLGLAGVLHLRIVDGKFLSAELAIVFVVVDKPTSVSELQIITA